MFEIVLIHVIIVCLRQSPFAIIPNFLEVWRLLYYYLILRKHT